MASSSLPCHCCVVGAPLSSLGISGPMWMFRAVEGFADVVAGCVCARWLAFWAASPLLPVPAPALAFPCLSPFILFSFSSSSSTSEFSPFGGRFFRLTRSVNNQYSRFLLVLKFGRRRLSSAALVSQPVSLVDITQLENRSGDVFASPEVRLQWYLGVKGKGGLHAESQLYFPGRKSARGAAVTDIRNIFFPFSDPDCFNRFEEERRTLDIESLISLCKHCLAVPILSDHQSWWQG
eukprot:g4582.t1